MRKTLGWLAAGLLTTGLVVGCSNEEQQSQVAPGAPGPAGVAWKPDPSKPNPIGKGKKASKPAAAPTSTTPSK
jgi:hypothetical protein